MALNPAPRALLFDVFGTCVDWRSTVTRELEKAAHIALNDPTKSIASRIRLQADYTTEDWGKLAQEWRNTYKVFTKALANDPATPWKTVDEHHLDSLKKLLTERHLIREGEPDAGLWNDEEIRALSLIWHHLDPWPDTSTGIDALNERFYTCTLSNGNLSLLADMASYAHMNWTHIFSAEQFGSYKPSPSVYLGAAAKLGLNPSECAMVACHLNDLRAAKDCGFQTIYVERPLEEDYSEQEVAAARSGGWVDLWVEAGQNGFITLAQKLGIEVFRHHHQRRRSGSAPPGFGSDGRTEAES
ncbi:HAD-like domain-containing protein [Cryomyces antarcticus]|nr:hypothetical protein LTR04_000589 [Oleoguttula sp. CCFEE 6159]